MAPLAAWIVLDSLRQLCTTIAGFGRGHTLRSYEAWYCRPAATLVRGSHRLGGVVASHGLGGVRLAPAVSEPRERSLSVTSGVGIVSRNSRSVPAPGVVRVSLSRSRASRSGPVSAAPGVAGGSSFDAPGLPGSTVPEPPGKDPGVLPVPPGLPGVPIVPAAPGLLAPPELPAAPAPPIWARASVLATPSRTSAIRKVLVHV
jgi:hypothetical protein